LSSFVAVAAHSAYNVSLLIFLNPAFAINALTLPNKVANAHSTILFCCGVSLAVYSHLIPKLSFSNIACVDLFSPALSYFQRSIFTWCCMSLTKFDSTLACSSFDFKKKLHFMEVY
jgi:hypothetical protein